MVIERYCHTQLFPLPQLKVIQLKKEERVYWKVLPHVHSERGLGGGVQCGTVLVIATDQSDIREGTCYSTELVLATHP